MKVKLTKTVRASENGVDILTYYRNHSYDVSDKLRRMFHDMGAVAKSNTGRAKPHGRSNTVQ